MKRPRELIEYGLLRAVGALLLSFPLDASLSFARLIADITFLFPTKFRRRGLQHLRLAYPAKSEAELNLILKGAFEHFAMVFVEILVMPRKIRHDSYRNYIEVKGTELINEELKKGHGVILIAAHFGNWELAGPVFGILGYPINAVARFMPNKRVDALLNYSRQYLGEKVIYKENAIKEMMRVLKKNELLAIVADQDARESGIFVNFMGIKSSTTRSPALLNIRFDAPLIMLTCYRARPDQFYYRLVFESCPVPANTKDVEQITQSFTSRLEAGIKERPAQWMWMHRRWKTKPPA